MKSVVLMEMDKILLHETVFGWVHRTVELE